MTIPPHVENLFHELADLLPEQRAAYYAEHNIEPELRDGVEKLLAYDHATSGDAWMKGAIEQLAMQAVSDIDAATSSRPEATIGAYRLLDLLGQGGMGVVYRAERTDGEITRDVAIKVVRGTMLSDPTLARFRNERQILARLEHPNIARLFDAGTSSDGMPYFVMEYIEGVPITSYCESNRLDISQRLALFLTVCEAVQYAHTHLVIHRDLKPGNILVKNDGTVKLLDFGIAKRLEHEPQQTATGPYLFTPDYCSPEQVQGDFVSTTTDVYALGCVLYELLSGKRPHNLSTYSPAELVHVVCESDPAPLSTAVPSDLRTIVDHTLRKDPAQRYPFVDLLRRDVENCLAGHPISVRPQTRLYRTRKFVQRHRLAVAATAAATILLIVTTVIAINREMQARERFNQLRKMARTFIFDFNDELQRVPGNTRATALLVSTASEYLENLARSAGDGDRDLIVELAQAYERLAIVQGGSSSNLNQRQAALESRRRAIDLRSRVSDGGNMDDNVKLVSAAGRIVNDLKDLGRLDDAVSAGTRAIELGGRLLRNAPSKHWADLAMVHVYFARALRRKGDLLAANRELGTAESLLAGATGDSAPRLRLFARWDRASLLLHLGALDQSRAILESLERDIPAVASQLPPGRYREATIRLLPTTWSVLAELHDNPLAPSLEQPARSIEYREKLCAQWQEHLNRDTHDKHALSQLGACYSEMALSRLKLDPQKAVLEARRGLDLYQRSAGNVERDDSTLSNTAHSSMALAMTLLAAGSPSEAHIAVTPAIDTMRKLAAAHKDSMDFVSLLIATLSLRSRIELALGYGDAARATAAEAAQLATPLARSMDLFARRTAANAYAANRQATGECEWTRKQWLVWQDWTFNSSPWVARQKQRAAPASDAACSPGS